MNLLLFETLLNRGESDTLDFKSTQYDFSGTPQEKETKSAKFIKDILSMANTIRTQSSYILLGIEQKSDGSKKMLGITTHYDDAMLQDKLKTKVYPLPKFTYETFEYNGLVFGIIEIPITKYIQPCIPGVKMPGIEIGKVYIRRGSQNSEALGMEIVALNEWLKSLISVEVFSKDYKEELLDILIEINAKATPISALITKLLIVSKRNHIVNLEKLCERELKGWSGEKIEDNDAPMYRVHEVFASPFRVEINPSPFQTINIDTVFLEMEKDNKFFKIKYLVPDSVSSIENNLNRGNNGDPKRFFLTTKLEMRDFFEDYKTPNTPIYIYTSMFMYIDIYNGLRSHLIKTILDLVHN